MVVLVKRELYDDLNGYEEKILFFFDDIDKSRTEYNEDFQLILDEMAYYKTVINAKMHEANGYFEIIENYDKNDVNKAVIDGEIFECTMSVHDNLQEYISFLVVTSEYLASGIADNFNEFYADSIREHTNTRNIKKHSFLSRIISSSYWHTTKNKAY